MRRSTWPPPYNFRSKELCRAGHTGPATKGALCSYISHRQRQRRRDDTTFKAPCKILQTCGTYYNNCPVCGTRLGYTPSCQPIPVHFVAANRDTSSKPPRFIRHWRRFGDFQKPWFLAAFFGYFLSLVKESNPPETWTSRLSRPSPAKPARSRPLTRAGSTPRRGTPPPPAAGPR